MSEPMRGQFEGTAGRLSPLQRAANGLIFRKISLPVHRQGYNLALLPELPRLSLAELAYLCPTGDTVLISGSSFAKGAALHSKKVGMSKAREPRAKPSPTNEPRQATLSRFSDRQLKLTSPGIRGRAGQAAGIPWAT